MSHSRRGNVLAAVAIAIGACVVTFALHRALHDEASALGGERPGTVIGVSGHENGRDAPTPEREADDGVLRSRQARLDAGGAAVERVADAEADVASAAEGADAGRDPFGPPTRSPHVEAFRHPSEAFRNTSLLALIRGAGYVCLDIVSSAAWDDASSAWRVSCDGARAYLVAELDGGELVVEPLEPFDRPVPRPFTTPFERAPGVDQVIPLEPR